MVLECPKMLLNLKSDSSKLVDGTIYQQIKRVVITEIPFKVISQETKNEIKKVHKKVLKHERIHGFIFRLFRLSSIMMSCIFLHKNKEIYFMGRTFYFTRKTRNIGFLKSFLYEIFQGLTDKHLSIHIGPLKFTSTTYDQAIESSVKDMIEDFETMKTLEFAREIITKEKFHFIQGSSNL